MSDINIIENSIWPTTDGRLGINKVPIPDGVNTFWPEGNAFVKNFIYKDDKLVGYIDTKSLIENESKTSVLPYEYVDITLDDELKYSMTFEKGENCKYLNIKYESSLPLGYKRLEYIESTGTQMMMLPFDSKGKEFECEHDAGLPTTTSGLYTYGGTSVSAGYGWRWHAGLQNLQFSHINDQLLFLARGTRHKIKWTVSKAESGYTFAMYADSNFVIQITQGFNAYWKNNYYLFSSTYYTSVIGGRAYDLKIKIGEDYYAHYIPALDPIGAPCMFDLVAREPFYNSGTDDFIYPNMETQATTYGLRNYMYAKMTEHGIRRLYHVPKNYFGTKEDYASENGFKQLVELPRPEEGNWIPNWIETDTELICDWIEIEEEIPSEN